MFVARAARWQAVSVRTFLALERRCARKGECASKFVMRMCECVVFGAEVGNREVSDFLYSCLDTRRRSCICQLGSGSLGECILVCGGGRQVL